MYHCPSIRFPAITRRSFQLRFSLTTTVHTSFLADSLLSGLLRFLSYGRTKGLSNLLSGHMSVNLDPRGRLFIEPDESYAMAQLKFLDDCFSNVHFSQLAMGLLVHWSYLIDQRSKEAISWMIPQRFVLSTEDIAVAEIHVF